MRKRNTEGFFSTLEKADRYEYFSKLIEAFGIVLPFFVFLLVTFVLLKTVLIPLKGNDDEISHMTDIAIDVYAQKVDGAALIYIPDGYSFEFTDTELRVFSNQYCGNVTLRLKEVGSASIANASSLSASDFTILVREGTGAALSVSIIIGVICSLLLFAIASVTSTFLDLKAKSLQSAYQAGESPFAK